MCGCVQYQTRKTDIQVIHNLNRKHLSGETLTDLPLSELGDSAVAVSLLSAMLGCDCLMQDINCCLVVEF